MRLPERLGLGGGVDNIGVSLEQRRQARRAKDKRAL